jgi:hypothetical protein
MRATARMTSVSTLGLSPQHTQAGRYQHALVRLYEQHAHQEGGLPTSGRFLYYEGVQVQAWPKHYDGRKRRVDQDVSDALMRLRELGLIPWDDIRDETRTLRTWRYADTVLAYLQDTLPLARINPWGTGLPPLVLCESRSLAGVLEDVLASYLVPVASTNGQVGGFLHTDIIPLLQQGPRRMFYLGDFDWQGGQIERNTRDVIEDALAEDFTTATWQRLALTERQVNDYRLPIIKKTDSRYRPPRTHDAVETEALSQSVLVKLVRDALDAALPEPLADVQRREVQQRVAVLRRLRGGS